MRTAGLEERQKGTFGTGLDTSDGSKWSPINCLLATRCMIPPDTLRFLLVLWYKSTASKKLSLHIPSFVSILPWVHNFYPPCCSSTCRDRNFQDTWFLDVDRNAWGHLSIPSWFLSGVCVILHSTVGWKGEIEGWCNRWEETFVQGMGCWEKEWLWKGRKDLSKWLKLTSTYLTLLDMQVSPAWGQAQHPTCIHSSRTQTPPSEANPLTPITFISFIWSFKKSHQSQVLCTNIFYVKIKEWYI